jgi:SSS family solute:Na+ symporter
VAFWLISSKVGGVEAASRQVLQAHPEKLVRGEQVSQLVFLTYFFIPLSVGMFPHVFQHWLTARSAKTFKLTVVLHPVLIMLLWAPCILLGLWATSVLMPDGSLVVPPGSAPNSELATMVAKLTGPVLSGLLGAGILAAIMSSLDSQFFCLGTMFTTDVVVHHFGEDRFDDRQRVRMARGFIVAVVALTYVLSLAEPRYVFPLGVWCFSGFAGLFPLVVAALYWRRVTKDGAIASVAAAMAVWFLLFRESGYGADPEYVFLGMLPVATIFGCSLLTLVGVSLLTVPPPEEVLERFFPKEVRSRAAVPVEAGGN